MKTTYTDMCNHLRNPELKLCEVNEYTVRQGFSEHGSSWIHIGCPFCKEQSMTTAWSFAGSGKRCENSNCGAIFGLSGVAYKKVVNE